MSNDSKQINASLRLMRDLIQTLPLGKDREALQSRFDQVVSRIEQVPARVMAQFDENTIANNEELEAVYRMELLWAIGPLDIET
jgi:hypothetical protein